MNKEDLLLEQWKMASELHRHEDNHSWQRYQYYITLTGILVSALGVVWTTTSIDIDNKNIAICIISFFGLVFSLVSLFIFKRSFMYHLFRIEQAKKAEEALRVNNERLLTIYQETLNKQTLVKVSKFGKFPTYEVVFYFVLFMTFCWTCAFAYCVYCII